MKRKNPLLEHCYHQFMIFGAYQELFCVKSVVISFFGVTTFPFLLWLVMSYISQNELQQPPQRTGMNLSLSIKGGRTDTLESVVI